MFQELRACRMPGTTLVRNVRNYYATQRETAKVIDRHHYGIERIYHLFFM